ncbi:MAG: Fe-S cluster assembly protein SufD [Ignavibacteriae bacterium]|nr:Fe-S cluster assembly protein SufD [Ignavibacteriota bacterium]MCB9210351.1 Fe-S cluster assembly protein SufD [Ignavibacteriales bacterium]MCB9219156.1 Fe-S cluster assembly protein SufD [Ignavibacteriales bacterium]MCB9259738.1 Fe-S cluster assembly protein SufD [Ignavibacteriales bacterium]
MSNSNIKKWYSDNFRQFEKLVESDSFNSLRKEALSKFELTEFPTKKDEEWKYTSISPILKHEFVPSPLSKKETSTISSIESFKIPNLDVHLLVFINGIYSKEFSNIGNLEEGIIIDSLFNQLKSNSDFINQYLSKKETIENSFSLLNTTFAYDGYVIYIPKNKIVNKPIHVLNIAADELSKPLIQPRNLIIAEQNSQAEIISEYVGKDKVENFTNIYTEISVDENANVRFYKVQNESDAAFHIDKTEIVQKDSSVFNHFSLSFGSKIARNDFNTKLDGENIELHLYGLYLGNDDQHIDHHTFIDHAKPNCESNELYKGILDDKAKGVFSGKILVNKIAQKTNAFQSNKSVLLSDEASIDAKPQLEIYADDVKCSHGATVGKLDEQAYFYIRSRGVPAEAARSMLIRAFVDDVISEINIEEFREKINHTIFEHLHREEF